MNRQKGQALVEFALLVPLLFTMCFAMIYGGMMFMDYLQYNNAARAVSRTISLTADEAQRKNIASDFENNNSQYIKPLTKIYKASPINVTFPGNDVKVAITLSLSEEANLPKILEAVNFPPKNLKTIEIIMPLEKSTDSE